MIIDLKYNLLDFINLLNKYNINFVFKKDKNYSIIFKKKYLEFKSIFIELLEISGNKYYIENVDYYTIIKSLVIYLA